MSKHPGGMGTFGGLNPPHDTSEQSEGRRFKPNDTLDDVLKDFVAPELGPHITNQTFLIESPLTRGMDITYDRYYPQLNLLTHSFARRRTYANLDDTEFDADVLRLRTYAEVNGYKFLAVIDGEVERDDINRLRVEINAAAV